MLLVAMVLDAVRASLVGCRCLVRPRGPLILDQSELTLPCKVPEVPWGLPRVVPGGGMQPD